VHDQEPTQEANGRDGGQRTDCIVELGGWQDELAWRELRTVAAGAVGRLDHRLALVDGVPSDLARLGGSRFVSIGRGSSTSVDSGVPHELAAALTGGTFVVRFVDPRGALNDADRRRLISQVWRAHDVGRPRVDLSHPDHDIHIFVTDEGLWFGERVAECAPELRLKSGVRRPFVRSYETPPRKARILVNVSGARPGVRFLDPFCGTGSMVIEAARVGSAAAGSDVDARAVEGAARNALFESVDAAFFIADARHLPQGRAPQCVATDLPYGRSASRRAASGRSLYVDFLDTLGERAEPGTRLTVMALDEDAPRNAPIGWELEWECREDARIVVRRISAWTRS
jgi:tRNA (guanine10-N2)-dimethyltransferase